MGTIHSFLYYETHDDFLVLSYWQLLFYLTSTENEIRKGNALHGWVIWCKRKIIFKINLSRSKEFCKKGVQKAFLKIRSKTPVSGHSFYKIAVLSTSTLFKMWLEHNCFSGILRNFISSTFFHRTPLVAASEKYFEQKQPNSKFLKRTLEKKKNLDSLLFVARFAAF